MIKIKTTRKCAGLHHWEDPNGRKWEIRQYQPSGFWRYQRFDHSVSSASFVSKREAITDLARYFDNNAQ